MIATDPVLAGIAAEKARARAELRLLACIVPIGRWGLALAERAGIRAEHFSQPDSVAIYAALLAAEEAGTIRDTLRTARLVRRALQIADLYDAGDTRQFVGAMRWGDAAIAALFCRVGKMDAERELPTEAALLLELAGEEVAR